MDARNGSLNGEKLGARIMVFLQYFTTDSEPPLLHLALLSCRENQVARQSRSITTIFHDLLSHFPLPSNDRNGVSDIILDQYQRISAVHPVQVSSIHEEHTFERLLSLMSTLRCR